ncbi:MAG: protein kinase [Myxococcaceae bacterium]|nr:protein kinase [Myxococcaceae bacterium]
MPDILGNYTLEKKIGAGGMADVFLARGPAGICVVKRPHPHLCENAEFVRMFLDEAALVAQLNHPGIARVFDLGHVAGSYYLAMEYVPGFDLMTISLEHERQGEFMDPELAARVVADAASALHYAHQAVNARGQALHIIHRDVTPHNILLSTTGQVKVIDFGVAKASQTAHKTQAGLVKGKYPYMSPEQITGQAIDRRVDVYALGLVLYELLTNSRAIAGDTELEQIDNARSGRIKPVEQVRPNVPEPLRRILAGALHPSPEGRYPTAAALQSDLEIYLKSERRPVGQEDLLRLFRVIAADATHLASGGVPSVTANAEKPEDETLIPGKPTEPWLPTPDQGAPLQLQPLPLHNPAVGPAPLQLTVQPVSADPGYDHPTERHLPAPPVASNQLPSQVPPRALADPVVLAGGPGLSKAVWLGGGIAALALVAAVAFWVWGGEPPKVDIAPPPAPVLAVVAAPPAVNPEPEVPPPAAETEAAKPEEVESQKPAPSHVENPMPHREASRPPGRDEALVTFKTEPTTEVFVDGKKRGSTPFELKLPAGRHQLKFVNKGLNFSRAQSLVLSPGEPIEVSFVAQRGKLAIHVEPFAEMFVDGKLVTTQPKSFSEVELWDGRYLVKVSNQELGKAQEQTVEIKNGQDTEVRFNLFRQ